MTRRTMFLGFSATNVVQTVMAQSVPTRGGELSSPDAHTLATSGQITLIDVRITRHEIISDDGWCIDASDGCSDAEINIGHIVP